MAYEEPSPSIRDELHDNRGWLIALGVLLIALGQGISWLFVGIGLGQR
jgi:hypothetical protein